MQSAMVVMGKEARRQKRRRKKEREKSLQSSLPELAVLGEPTTETAAKHFQLHPSSQIFFFARAL